MMPEKLASFRGGWDQVERDLIAEALTAIEEKVPLKHVSAAEGALWTCTLMTDEEWYQVSRLGFAVIISARTSMELREKLFDLVRAFEALSDGLANIPASPNAGNSVVPEVKRAPASTRADRSE